MHQKVAWQTSKRVENEEKVSLVKSKKAIKSVDGKTSRNIRIKTDQPGEYRLSRPVVFRR